MNDILAHYGVKRRSGRYPWGSGDTPYQRSGDFLSRVEELSKDGISEKELAAALGMTTTDLRMQLRVAKHERRNLEVARAKSLREDGKTLQEITDIMGYKNDSSVRALLNESTASNKNQARNTADILKKELENKRMIDVGVGVERELGVSAGTLQEALFILRTEGYEVYPIGIPQVTNSGKQINTPILCMPDIEYKDVYQNMGDIQSVRDYHSTDGGLNYNKREYPASIDSNRVHIRYGDQGGTSKDGVIELRRGVADLDLGKSHYAQVRILVDGTHYLKGMAMYSNDIPDGVDIVFNTNKQTGTDKYDVFKAIKKDPENPFGAYIKSQGQSTYIDLDGKEKLSAINKLKEEGDWDSMSKNLSSQFLSKQPKELFKKQLNLTYADAMAEYDEIKSLTNPTVKKKMLLDFADECDGAVTHLKAAALPRQKTQVILPITAMKDNEVYAPNYQNGEKVALVRYPHGGTFEIPILTVNNKNKTAIDILGRNVTDAVGINPKVAERLSGADFDGDQVVVIPTNDKVRIKSTPHLEELKGFEPKTQYAYRDGIRTMKKSEVQKQMGMISNLITDMTLKGANNREIARAVKHSMVVIDAEKHKLDFKQSEIDNDIASLKKRYQGYISEEGKNVGGASTLISRKSQTVYIPERQGSGIIDKATGEVIFKETGRTYLEEKKVTDKETGKISYIPTGNVKEAQDKVSLMDITKDIRTLSSGTAQENTYADYANKMKALANEARKEYTSTGNIVYSSSAKATYQNEVSHLESQLNGALKNAPRERQAQAIANSVVKAKLQEYPELTNDKKEVKKLKQQSIYDARNTVSASGKNTRITISDREWEAIQAGAITDSKLSKILRYADPDEVKQRATPRTTTQLSTAKINKIKTMSVSGYTNEEIAKAIGASASMISKYIKE